MTPTESTYRQLVGLLRNVAGNFHPDLTFVTGRLSRAVDGPKELQLNKSVYMIRYIMCTVSHDIKHVAGHLLPPKSVELRLLPAGSPVLVYRTTTNPWEEPFNFISAKS